MIDARNYDIRDAFSTEKALAGKGGKGGERGGKDFFLEKKIHGMSMAPCRPCNGFHITTGRATARPCGIPV
jgi:hypothetical protein